MDSASELMVVAGEVVSKMLYSSCVPLFEAEAEVLAARNPSGPGQSQLGESANVHPRLPRETDGSPATLPQHSRYLRQGHASTTDVLYDGSPQDSVKGIRTEGQFCTVSQNDMALRLPSSDR